LAGSIEAMKTVSPLGAGNWWKRVTSLRKLELQAALTKASIATVIKLRMVISNRRLLIFTADDLGASFNFVHMNPSYSR